MKSEKKQSRTLTVIVAIAVLAALTCGCEKDDRGGRQTERSSQVTVRNGRIVVTMERADQDKAGIVAASPVPARHQEDVRAYAKVLGPAALIDIRNDYLAARASSDKASAVLDASLQEYERLKKLNEDDRNISDKELQKAGALLAVRRADVTSAGGKYEAIRRYAAVQWGSVISGWIYSGSPKLVRLMEMKDVLIRVTFPSDRLAGTAPASIVIHTPESKRIAAGFVDRAPDADPRTQGTGLFYLASSEGTGLVPGMNVDSLMPTGHTLRGVVIPFSAIVWAQGKAWAYVQTGPTLFERQEVPVSERLREGYFVTSAFSPEEKVVVTGAEILLSRESMLSMPAAREEDED